MARIRNLLPLMVVGAIGSFILLHHFTPGEAGPPTHHDGGIPSDSDALAPLQVLVIGDFGTGEAGQREIAGAIAETHRLSPPDLVLTVGDNFYPRGVKDLRDPLWRTAFEEVYRGPFWDELVFSPVLGNHDHYGNSSAEIAYSLHSTAWDLPSPYYAFRRPLNDGDSVLFLALDTDPLQAAPSDAGPQLRWADSVLGSSTDRWVVAYGHHPLFTGGRHATSRRLRESLAPVLEHRVSLYLSGHNHSTELLLTEKGFEQGVCGGAGGRDNPYGVGTSLLTLKAFTGGGWCFLRFWPDSMAVELYDGTGDLQYRYVDRSPRAGSTEADPAPNPVLLKQSELPGSTPTHRRERPSR